ncbi:MAG: PAS domain S-box protein [Nitrospirae bacterium]|nr:PAS domain S-box protein [Nitrospirota bacterium]
MKILIVDDSDESRVILRNILCAAECAVEEASNGIEALKSARQSPPDIFISGIFMPELDGFSLCQEVKKDGQLNKIPFVFYADSHTAPEDEKLAMALGASRFIIKPAEPAELLKNIKDVIREFKGREAHVLAARSKESDGAPVIYDESLAIKLDQELKELVMKHRSLLEREAALRESEEQFRLIVQNADEIIYSVEIKNNPLEGRLSFVSNQITNILGYQPDEFINDPSLWFHIIHPEDLQSVADSTDKIIKNCKKATRYYRIRHKDTGEYRHIEDMVVPLAANNTVTGFLGMARDITERKELEDSLWQSETRYRLLFEHANDAIYLIAPETEQIIDCNNKAAEMDGYTVEELKNMKITSLHPDNELDVVRERLKEVSQSGSVSCISGLHHIRKDGVFVLIEVNATMLEIGGKLFSLGIVRDISERKMLEDQLIHAQKMEAVGQLAGGIAHDFNNMLTAIIGYGNLLKMKLQDNGQHSHIIDQILGITDRGASLVSNLLAFSRKQAVSLRPVNLNKIIEDAVRFLPKLTGEGIDIKINLAGRDLIIMADSVQIEQILMNLASNARDAMPEGGVLSIKTECVEIDSELIKARKNRRTGAYALLSVSDGGTGMDEAIKGKIFEPFFTTKEVGKGTGLGLSMIYGIVKQHGGYIDVHSELRNGSIFKIYLPLTKETPGEKDRAERSFPAGGRETILIAEDEHGVRKTLKIILEEFGYKVIEAADGADAVKKFMDNRNNIQLLLFDVMMPKKNGIEAFEEIKNVAPDMKVIFTSGYAAKVAVAGRGLLHFIPKPVEPNDLMRKIREVLDA